MKYDGNKPIGPVIADLYGISRKSQSSITVRLEESKTALGITSKSKNLPAADNLAIYNWHKNKLRKAKQKSPVQHVKQTKPVKVIKQQEPDNIPVQDIKQPIDSTVQNIKQPIQTNDPDFAQIHFGVTVSGRRTTVMLEGYLVKALQRRHGLTGNTEIRTWLEASIKAVGFDNNQATTKQVKRLIIESFV